MNYLQAVILGIIEGLTEFLPVSSTGHMIIGSSLMGIAENPFTKAFTVAIQLGAILSVLVLYWRRFIQSFKFYWKLFIAFVPAAVVGLSLIKTINYLLGDVLVVAISLFIGGFILIWVDYYFKDSEEHGDTEVSYKTSFLVGLFQCFALIPGTSRSGATIIGGLFGKLNKKTAAEFSFFLAVPTMVAATGYKLLEFYLKGPGFQGNEIGLLVVGTVVAFIVAMFAIKSFITYLTSHGFKIFGYYRIIVGLTIIVLHLAGINMVMF
ncbi:MAG TPA: undecaprenyl-diphosphate phosphatase [Balneolales bacterium]|nr:undecaprenyl-diphosphate phosphatase [Balneolales bacterium]